MIEKDMSFPTTRKYEFGDALLESLEEALAWKRGEIALETVPLEPTHAQRVRRIASQDYET